jgi:hypothetical protein
MGRDYCGDLKKWRNWSFQFSMTMKVLNWIGAPTQQTLLMPERFISINRDFDRYDSSLGLSKLEEASFKLEGLSERELAWLVCKRSAKLQSRYRAWLFFSLRQSLLMVKGKFSSKGKMIFS